MNKFLQEIFEQPQVLENTLNFYLNGEGHKGLEKAISLWKHGNFDRILFTGMGSSYFAPHTASCILSSAGIVSGILNAGELLHYHLPLLNKKTLLVCVSQSGESYEIVQILNKIPSGVKCIGITNEENSTVALKTDIVLLSKAGKEEMTSTKTYITTLLVLSIFARALAGKWKPGEMPEYHEMKEAVSTLIDSNEKWLAPAMNHLGHPPFVQIIGRGPSYSSVLQGALMFMEAARNPASGLYGGEFRHGPMEMSKKGFRAVIFAPLGPTFGQSVKLAEDVTRFEGKVILITNCEDKINNSDILQLYIPCKDEFLFPVAAIVPLQFIVNQWAVDEGHIPGNFIMGAKVTTTE